MAKDDTPRTDIDALASAISRGITEAAQQTGPIRQIPITHYRTKTPWNPSAAREIDREALTRVCMQNGGEIQQWHVTDEDIRLLNRLKPGRYLERKVEVIERYAEDGSPPSIDIRYNNATADQRFELKNHFRSFSELLRLIIAEQEGAVAA